jgi:hypothetical protein
VLRGPPDPGTRVSATIAVSASISIDPRIQAPECALPSVSASISIGRRIQAPECAAVRTSRVVSASISIGRRIQAPDCARYPSARCQRPTRSLCRIALAGHDARKPGRLPALSFMDARPSRSLLQSPCRAQPVKALQEAGCFGLQSPSGQSFSTQLKLLQPKELIGTALRRGACTVLKQACCP